VYEPRCMGNPKLPKAERVVVSYRLMTAEQEEKYSTMYLQRGGDDDFGMTVEPHAVEIWTECVTSVAGLEDESGKALVTAKDVLKVPGIYEMVQEVAAVIKRGLSEEDLKN